MPRFWDEAKRLGSPLLEPVKDHPGFVLVTFLWHGSPGTRDVSLLSGPQFLSHYTNRFARLPDSDLWYLTVEMPEGVRIGYVIAETSASTGPDGASIEKQSGGSDPLNLRRSEYDPTLPPSGSEPYSVFETPNAPPEPWLRRHAGVRAGTIETHEIQSQILGSKRKVKVYRPRTCGPVGHPVGSLYLFDGESYLADMHIADVLDNLIGEGKIEPVIAILIDAPPDEARDKELQCDPKFTEFICSELVPWVQARYPVSRDPGRTTIGGYSLGALEAAFVARHHPELFGAVLAQSLSLWWKPKDASVDEKEPWIAQAYLNADPRQTRIFLSVGRDEPTILEKARVFDRLLRNHGIKVDLDEIEGQHDPINWRLTLPRGLLFLCKPPAAP